ncbi:hypothetical protein Hanom_Chr04g00347751 [Helianthus anomalus]
MRGENCKKTKVSWPKTLKKWFNVKNKAEDFHADAFSHEGFLIIWEFLELYLFYGDMN